MTTLYTKSDGPAVLSSALLDAFDAFAQSLVAHPHRMIPEMWPKGWLFFEAGWNAAILAEREACKQAIRDTKDRSGTNYDGQNWLVRAGRSDFIAALDARST